MFEQEKMQFKRKTYTVNEFLTLAGKWHNATIFPQKQMRYLMLTKIDVNRTHTVSRMTDTNHLISIKHVLTLHVLYIILLNFAISGSRYRC